VYITGLGGSIGMNEIKQANPDGLTIGIGATSNLITYPLLHSDASYNPLQDFSYITNIVYVPHILIAQKNIAGNSFADFLAQIKINSYSYLSPGTGSSPYFLMQSLSKQIDVNLKHIPLKDGTASAIKAIKVGRGEIMAGLSLTSLPFVLEQQSDAGLVVAVASPNRISELPNTPTLAELGFANLNKMSTFGLIAPAKVDVKVIELLNNAMQKVLKSSLVTTKLAKYGCAVQGLSSSQFLQQTQNEYNSYKQIMTNYQLAN